MIRDPSDGSVREKRKIEVSGLAGPTKEQKDEWKRLEMSREWLKDYQARKASQHERDDKETKG